MKKNVVLILSGYNHRGAVAFCRFCKANKIPFYIVASDKNDLINFTEYKKNVISTRQEKKLLCQEFLLYKNKIHREKKGRKIVILPSTEYLNRFLLSERNTLEQEGFLIPLVNERLYAEVSDKYSFNRLCQSNSIAIPNEYKEVNTSKIPFVAKPKQYFTEKKTVNEKPFLIHTEKEYNELQAKTGNAEFYYQEFVGGESFYLLYYFDKRGMYKVYSQQNLMQQDNGLSIIAAKSSNFHQNQIAKQFANIFIQKKYTGLLMIEVKEYNEKIYMIEANPRLWGPSQLIVDSGMDLFYQFAFDFDLLERSKTNLPKYQLGVRYFWSGGIFEDQHYNREIAFHAYSGEQFLKEYKDWILSDVYMREDTQHLYSKELKEI